MLARKKTNEEFVEEVRQLVGDEYTFLEEYKGSMTKIKCKHNIEYCQHEWYITPNAFLMGNRCPNHKMKTNEEFIKEVNKLVGDEYVFLEKYINNETKIKCKHNIEDCGHEWDVRPVQFLSGSKCPRCAGNQKKTDKQFKDELYSLVGDEYIILGEYKGTHIEILCKHNIDECGYEWHVRPSKLLQGTRCPKCNVLSRTKTNEEFVKEVYDLVGNEYTFLDKYINNGTKIKCRHNECGYEWDISPKDFLQGIRCPNHIIRTNEDFLEKVESLVGEEYIFLEDYINTQTPIKCKHIADNCEYEWYISPNNFLRGRRCPKCAGTMRKTTASFKEEVYDLVGDEYTVLGEYKNNRTKILLKHNKCNYEWDTLPDNFLSRRRCPQCSKSRGEEKIGLYLKKNNIQNIPQHSYDDCRRIYPLPFDYYLPNYNLLIEYDGEGHYRPVNFGGCSDKMALENFKQRQQNDKTKNEYCNKQNIKLLRIPYWDFDNIEQILNNELKVGEEECRKIS